MYAQKCFCLEETACYRAKSTEEKNLRLDITMLYYILPISYQKEIMLLL